MGGGSLLENQPLENGGDDPLETLAKED